MFTLLALSLGDNFLVKDGSACPYSLWLLQFFLPAFPHSFMSPVVRDK